MFTTLGKSVFNPQLSITAQPKAQRVQQGKLQAGTLVQRKPQQGRLIMASAHQKDDANTEADTFDKVSSPDEKPLAPQQRENEGLWATLNHLITSKQPRVTESDAHSDAMRSIERMALMAIPVGLIAAVTAPPIILGRFLFNRANDGVGMLKNMFRKERDEEKPLAPQQRENEGLWATLNHLITSKQPRVTESDAHSDAMRSIEMMALMAIPVGLIAAVIAPPLILGRFLVNRANDGVGMLKHMFQKHRRDE